MTLSEFKAAAADTQKTTIVDIWAPWCGPCKAMKPVFDSLSQEFGDRARVLSVDADESQELLQEYRIYAVPTVLVFHGGNEIARRKGAQSESDLRALFEAAVEGQEIPGMNHRTRILRIAGAAAAALLSLYVHPAWPLQLGAALLFGLAIHDRCPILKALKRTVTVGIGGGKSELSG